MQAQHIEFLQLLNGDRQYVVPRWQRRYCWGQSDIGRLVDDLLTIAVAGPNATHYAGTLLTFPEPGPAGVMSTIRVVDGQQRLTTVSILLACIAAKLERDGPCGDWTAQIIRERRLTNPHMPPAKRCKLKLQHADRKEYRLGLDGRPQGSGAVAQAWRIARRLVDRNDVARLLKGLERLRVVSIGLGSADDPQQIFESLNATGRPLTESEKIKNWLLLGLKDDEQRDLYDNHWLQIERKLGAEYTTKPVDIFLRDFLRWKTGKIHGIDRVYEEFRRWAVQQKHAEDRPALCRELARLAGLYGILTGTAGTHRDRQVELELRHLREFGIDVHRPLTLRLLDDITANGHEEQSDFSLPKTLAVIGSWITRMWLAARPMAGLNTAMAELANGSGPSSAEDSADHWFVQIRKLRDTRVGVPSDEEVREGLRTRKAYGGSATRSSFAILCALMEAEHGEEAPARDRLTIEHVMPQKLTENWRSDLGEEAEDTHARYRDRLSNLTLSGAGINAGMGARPFHVKRDTYQKSPIGMTRRLADKDAWNDKALRERSEELSCQALDRWPWPREQRVVDQHGSHSANLRWRVDSGPWHDESAASQMVLNVAGALLSLDPLNAQKLSGNRSTIDVHEASRFPPEPVPGGLVLRAIPRHHKYVLHPYCVDYPASVKRCQQMGKQCGVIVEAEVISKDGDLTIAFWAFLKRHTGGVPGQKGSWRGRSQWTDSINAFGDRVGIHVGKEWLWIYIRAGVHQVSQERAARMRRYSWIIRDQMADQVLGENLERESREGRTVCVFRRWAHEDEDEWPEAAQWMIDQYVRLRVILTESEI